MIKKAPNNYQKGNPGFGHWTPKKHKTCPKTPPRHQHTTKKGPLDTNISLKSVPQTPQSARKTGSTRPTKSKKIPEPPYQPDPARPIKPTRPTIDKTPYANHGPAECAKRLNNRCNRCVTLTYSAMVACATMLSSDRKHN